MTSHRIMSTHRWKVKGGKAVVLTSEQYCSRCSRLDWPTSRMTRMVDGQGRCQLLQMQMSGVQRPVSCHSLLLRVLAGYNADRPYSVIYSSSEVAENTIEAYILLTTYQSLNGSSTDYCCRGTVQHQNLIP